MTQLEVEAMICDPDGIDRDEKGNPMYLEPDLIVTIFRKERW